MNQKIKILFVDDESRILEALRRNLYSMRQEWETSFALGGRKAMEMIQENPFDIVVSDIKMPGIDGVTLLTWVKKEYPGMVRFALSGQSSKESVLRSVGPIHQYISKPCEVETLKSKIQRVYSIKEIFEKPALEALINQLESLPCISATCTKLMNELRSPHASLDDIAVIISEDLGMSVKILQMVNSAFFGINHRIYNIAEAVKLLGLDIVSSLAVSLKIFSQFPMDPDNDAILHNILKHSLDVSRYTKQILMAESLNKETVDTAVISGMLHDVGKPVIMATLPDSYKEIVKYRHTNHVSDLEAEHQILDCGHPVIGAYLLGLWGLDSEIIDSLRYHHNPNLSKMEEPIVLAAIHVANAISVSPEAVPLQDNTLLDIEFLQHENIWDRLPQWQNLVKR